MAKTPATVRIPAPSGLSALPAELAEHFSAVGLATTIDGSDLVLTRTGKYDPTPEDADALPPLLDQPFQDQETANLRGLVAAWETAQAE
jgi:hypothetical protein